MATVICEKREFTDRLTGEIRQYEVFAIAGEIDGEYTELRLKDLSPAEKIAWRMLAKSDYQPGSEEVTTRKATREEEESFLKQQENPDKIDLDED